MCQNYSLGASGVSRSSCRCRFLANVCDWRMNDRINTLFLFSFVMVEYTYSFMLWAIEIIVLVCGVCCIRETTRRYVSAAAHRFKWWQVWQEGVIAQAKISGNFFPAQSSGNYMSTERQKESCVEPWTVLFKCMQWFIINPNHLWAVFFSFYLCDRLNALHQFYHSNRKCLGEKHRNT